MNVLGERIRCRVRRILNLDESPERTALAFSVGVFVGCSPLLGLHTFLGLGIAFFFRLSRAAVLLGTWLNNPWTLVPFYALAGWVGMMITGLPVPRELQGVEIHRLLDPVFWSAVASGWRLLIPVMVGSTLLSFPLALISYPIALGVIRHYRHRRALRRLTQGQEA